MGQQQKVDNDSENNFDKFLDKLTKPDQIIVLKRVQQARKFGWHNIQFWNWDDKPTKADLVGFSPNDEFNFVPELSEEGD